MVVGLLLAVAGAALGLTPRRHRVASTRGLALATTERVVDRVHCDTAGLGANALPAVATGLADLDEIGFGVADDTDGGTTVDRNTAHLGAGKPQRCVRPSLATSWTLVPALRDHAAAGARLEFDVVDDGTDRDVSQRKCVARRILSL